jgi:hypothetical protein
VDSLRNRWLLGALGVVAVCLVLLLAAKPLGLATTRMSVREYNEHAKDGSRRKFIVSGKVVDARPTGAHTVRAGVFDVHFSGGLELQSPDGKTLHRLRIADEDGAKALLYFDPQAIELPPAGSEVEVRGKFQTTQARSQLGPPRPFTFGLLSRVELLR